MERGKRRACTGRVVTHARVGWAAEVPVRPPYLAASLAGSSCHWTLMSVIIK
jgi:hypothetical protein